MKKVFDDYRLRVGEVVIDTNPPPGIPVLEQRFDETEVGSAKFVTLTEIQPRPDAGEIRADDLPQFVELDVSAEGIVDYNVFSSIYSKGKLALLVSWRNRDLAKAFAPKRSGSVDVRHRLIRVVRDYGMFDRRESPQFYPEVQRHAVRS